VVNRNIETAQPKDAKPNWIAPKVTRLHAGAAESNETGNQFDISNPQRS
jgi:hypothetical protein